ncbi:hypothetical protein GCM10027053_41540 [Intrasporangium mesophilum]
MATPARGRERVAQGPLSLLPVRCLDDDGAHDDLPLLPNEQVFDRTSVRVVARLFDEVETRIEQVFGNCVRTSYAVLTPPTTPVTTDTGPHERSSGAHRKPDIGV